MNRVLVALALAGWAALPTAARANVSLTFAPAGYVHSGPNASLPLNFQLLLTLTNAAVANGRFDLSGVGPAGLPPRFSGDVAEFVSLAALGDGATPS